MNLRLALRKPLPWAKEPRYLSQWGHSPLGKQSVRFCRGANPTFPTSSVFQSSEAQNLLSILQT
jgi:hypothetical protein